MCNNDNTTLVPYALKTLADPNACTTAYVSLNHNLTQAALEHYRLQLYSYASYADRFRYTHPMLSAPFALASPYASPGHHLHHHHPGHQGTATGAAGATGGGGPSTIPHDAFVALSPYAKFDPRAFRIQEEPKPQHSYIGLIGMAILSSPEKKLVLSDIYQYILDNYAYFRARGPGWRNSIRHNLSLNDCFIKSGRSANGKGHYWAIHPANLEDFTKGDFRRRKAQRRVRRHMGLSVPDDDDSTSPPPLPASSVSPRPTTPGGSSSTAVSAVGHTFWNDVGNVSVKPDSTTTIGSMSSVHAAFLFRKPSTTCLPISRRRQFDVESLLAPDQPKDLVICTPAVESQFPQYSIPRPVGADDRSVEQKTKNQNDRSNNNRREKTMQCCSAASKNARFSESPPILEASQLCQPSKCSEQNAIDMQMKKSVDDSVDDDSSDSDSYERGATPASDIKKLLDSEVEEEDDDDDDDDDEDNDDDDDERPSKILCRTRTTTGQSSPSLVDVSKVSATHTSKINVATTHQASIPSSSPSNLLQCNVTSTGRPNCVHVSSHKDSRVHHSCNWPKPFVTVSAFPTAFGASAAAPGLHPLNYSNKTSSGLQGLVSAFPTSPNTLSSFINSKTSSSVSCTKSDFTWTKQA